MDLLLVVLVVEQFLVIDIEVFVCIFQDILQLNMNLVGGDWLGVGIDSDGLIDLSVVGGGIFIYIYSYVIGIFCVQLGIIDI